MSSESSSAPPGVLDSPCAECARETRHYVRGQVKQRGSEPDGYYSWSQTTHFLECAGCGATSIRKVFWDSASDEEDIEVYPPRLPRRKPTWFWQLEPRLQTLLKEVYDSLGTGASALPVMGARTLLDMVIQDRVGDQGDFKTGLDALVTKGLVSLHDREILAAAVDAASAAAHRGFAPKEQDVDRVIEIVEHLLNSQYVLQKAAEDLRQTTPRRKKSPKAKL